MRRPLPALIVLAVLLAGCGIDEDVVAREAAEAAPPPTTAAPSSTTTEPEPVEPASPFVLDDPPDGYLVRVDGTGEDEPDDEALPVTVLAPDGTPEGAGVVFVEAVPDDEDEGYTGAGDNDPWAALVTDGLRVWGVDADADELQDIADAASAPAAPGLAPEVDDPPGDLEVVGSITVDGVLALAAPVPDDTDGPVPGPASAHTAVYVCDEDCEGSVVVMTLPGGALDPAAVVTEARAPRNAADDPRESVVEEIDDDDLDGVVVTTADPVTGRVVRRTLAAETAWGDVLLVITRGADGLDAEELIDLADEVEQDEE